MILKIGGTSMIRMQKLLTRRVHVGNKIVSKDIPLQRAGAIPMFSHELCTV